MDGLTTKGLTMDDDLDPDRNGTHAGHGEAWHEPAPDDDDGRKTLANVAGWEIPVDARRTEGLRQVVVRLVARGLDHPQDLATLTLPGLVATIGQLEAKIVELEQSLDQVIAILRNLTRES